MPPPDTLDPRILGQRIAEARKARGKTQEEVADFLGCSRPTYIAIEKGDRLAKSEEIVKLASFLGRKVNELVPPDGAGRGPPAAPSRRRRENEGGRPRGPQRRHRRASAARRGLPRLGEADERALAHQLPAGGRAEPPHRLCGTGGERGPARNGSGSGWATSRCIYLRNTLEWDVGLRIFYWNLPSPIAGMYAYTADLGCCILVNRKHPPSAGASRCCTSTAT